MAGTRLLIQASVAVQFLLLVGAAVFFGLCQQGDDICALLFHSKDRRLYKFHAQTHIIGPVVSVAVPDAQLGNWKRALERRHESNHVKLVITEKLSKVCSDSGELEDASEHDLWVCSGAISGINNMVASVKVLPSGSSIVYPSTAKINDLLEGLIPLISRVHTRKNLQFTLITQDSTWMPWSKALSQVVDSIPFSNLPCLKHENQKRVLVDGTLSASATPLAKGNRTLHHISTRAVEQVLNSATSQAALSNTALNIVVYIPTRQKTPMVILEDRQRHHTSTSAFVDLHNRNQQAMFTIANHRAGASHYHVIHNALESVVPVLHDQCLGFPPGALEMEPPGSVGVWQIKLSLHRLLSDTYAEAYNELMRLHGFLLESSKAVDSSGEATQRLMDARDMMDEAALRAQSGDWDLALGLLESSLYTSRAALTADNLMEPLDFPPEHAFAIFSPLLFPLLIPLLVGLIREVKRYNKLQSKRK